MALNRGSALALNVGETPGIKTLIDKVNGHIFVLTADKLVKCSLAGFTRTDVIALTATAHDIELNTDDGLIYVLSMAAGSPSYTAVVKAYNIADLSLAATSVATLNSYNYLGEWFYAKLLYKNSFLYVYHSKPNALIYLDIKVSKLNPTTLVEVSASSVFNGINTCFVYNEAHNFIHIFYYITGARFVKTLNADTLTLISTNTLTALPARCVISNDCAYLYANVLPISGLITPSSNELARFNLSSWAVTMITGLVINTPIGIVKDEYSEDIFLISYESPSTIKKISTIEFSVLETLTLPAGDNQIKSLGINDSLSGTDAEIYGADSSAPSDVIKILSPYTIYSPKFTVTCLPEVGQIQLNLVINSRNVTNVRVYRRIQGVVDFTLLGETATDTFIDTTAINEVIYEYKVQQYRGGAWEEESPIVTHTCAWYPWTPCSPDNIRFVYASPHATIYWDYSSTGLCGQTVNWIDGFKVYRKRDDEAVYTNVFSGSPALRYYLDANLVAGHTYQYYITAYNSRRASNASKIITVTT